MMASPEGGNPPVNGQVSRIEIENTDVFEEYREEEYRDTDVRRKKKRQKTEGQEEAEGIERIKGNVKCHIT